MCSIAEHFQYQMEKEAALKASSEQKNKLFVETLAMVIESSSEISGGRAAELMEYISHLLFCRKICWQHGLMPKAQKGVKDGV